MLLYTTVGTNDLQLSARFYDAIFDVMGQERMPSEEEGWAAWGKDYDSGFSFCLCEPFDGQPASAGNGTMFAFRAESADQVRKFHAAGLSHGGQCDGPPGTRDAYGAAFYVAYLRDPDGNKLACAFHRYDAAMDADQASRAG